MFAALNSSKMGNYTVYHRNESEFIRNYNELFIKNLYKLTPTNEKVLIIDAGAHIGMAAIYIKMVCPNAKVICFEPNPYTFHILQKNIFENNLMNVELINMALSDTDGQTSLYGELDGISADTRGNSIVVDWGKREHTEGIIVQTTRLSHYLDESIYFLKMDLEGAESAIISEIGNKTEKIGYAVIDLHGTGQYAEKDLNKTIKKFELTHSVEVKEKDVHQSIPPRWKSWLIEKQPLMKVLYATRKITQIQAQGFSNDASLRTLIQS